MKKEFWLERWERQEIGFHQSEINPYLCQYWNEVHAARESEVFVPLCGKSRDMLWLRKQGHTVLGVELSAIAAQAFFKENGCIAHCGIAGKSTAAKRMASVSCVAISLIWARTIWRE